MNDINFLIANKVDIKSGIETLGEELYKETLTMFLDEIMDKIQKIQESLTSNNLKDYATYVHAIKGESLYLGFKDLASLSYNHQIMAESGNYEYIRNNYVSLITEIGRVIKVSRIYLGKDN